MSKQYPGNFFEDFELDQLLVHGTPRTVTEGDMSLYIALTGSRYPLHCARPFAQGMGQERESVDDLLAFHIAFGKTVSDVSLNRSIRGTRWNPKAVLSGSRRTPAARTATSTSAQPPTTSWVTR